MSIDFEIPAEAKAIREKVRQWVHDECIPRKRNGHQPLDEVLGETTEEGAGAGAVVPVRAEGIWRHGPRPARQRPGADGARAKARSARSR